MTVNPIDSPSRLRPWMQWAARTVLVVAFLAIGAFVVLAGCFYWRTRHVIMSYEPQVVASELDMGPLRVEQDGECRRCVQALGGPAWSAWQLDAYLRLPTRWAPRQGTAARIMSACGEKAICPLTRESKSPNVDIRAGVAYALACLASPSAQIVETLEKLAHDTDPDVRCEAIIALGRVKGDAAIAHLIELLEDPDRNVQSCAIWTIGELGGSAQKAAPHLRNLACDANGTDSRMRANAAGALWMVTGAGDTSREVIGEVLSAPDGPTRAHAARVLGRIGPAASVMSRELRMLTYDEDASVREAARIALGRICPNGASETAPGTVSESKTEKKAKGNAADDEQH